MMGLMLSGSSILSISFKWGRVIKRGLMSNMGETFEGAKVTEPKPICCER
ncbi:hypothetical protein NBRC116492_13960 [Aurantivibrio infirmus]